MDLGNRIAFACLLLAAGYLFGATWGKLLLEVLP